MRALKFRAWDNKEHKYLFPYPDAFWIIGETTVFGMLQPISIEDFNNILIEQFIGLKDGNGKDIFEGDIIILDNSIIGGEKVVGEVMFNLDGTLSNLEWGIWTEKGYYSTDFLGEIEVIGNKYEGKTKVYEDSTNR